MDFHELQKTRVTDLREMMKEHLPEVAGVIALKKEELVAQLAAKLGIAEAHDHAELRKYRREIHRRKRRLRRMMQLS